jgi:hypothetical protein
MGADQCESFWDKLLDDRRLEALERAAAESDPALDQRTMRERIEFYGVHPESHFRLVVDQALKVPISKPRDSRQTRSARRKRVE